MEKRYTILALIFGFVIVGAFSVYFLIQKNTFCQINLSNEGGVPCRQEVQSIAIEEEVNSPFNFSLHVGDIKKIGNLRIQLTDITDSRCPADVQCFWAGEVKATVTFSLGDKSEYKTLTLSGAEEKILGYSVKFIRVTPSPRRANSPVDKKEYQTTFYVIKEMSPAAGEEGIIRGVVTIGPMCPVVRVGEDCPDKPYPTTLLLQDQNKYTLKTIIVPESGQFELRVPAGSYTVVPKVDSVMPRAESVSVTVSSGQVSTVTISFDSGIR